jgi:hypothetical protein
LALDGALSFLADRGAEQAEDYAERPNASKRFIAISLVLVFT